MWYRNSEARLPSKWPFFCQLAIVAFGAILAGFLILSCLRISVALFIYQRGSVISHTHCNLVVPCETLPARQGELGKASTVRHGSVAFTLQDETLGNHCPSVAFPPQNVSHKMPPYKTPPRTLVFHVELCPSCPNFLVSSIQSHQDRLY